MFGDSPILVAAEVTRLHLQSRSDFMKVAVGLQPTERAATCKCVAERRLNWLAAFQPSRRDATAVSARNRGLKPTATINHRYAMAETDDYSNTTE
jgi:hypothetical protein